jgi:hypothetical protein
MQLRYCAPTVAAVFALTMMAGQAFAASLTQIDYEVTGGSFGGFVASGSITGGHLTIRPASLVPSSYFGGGATRGSWELTLSSISGGVVHAFESFAGPTTAPYPYRPMYLTVFPPSSIRGGGVIGYIRGGWDITCTPGPCGIHAQGGRIQVGATNNGSGAGFLAWSMYFPPPFLTVVSYSNFTVGNEVRTIAEPHEAWMIGPGLIVLGLLASRRAATARTLRHRRG